jgi:two-component system response regulator HydG
MQDIFLNIRKISPTDANVLIFGENGTGKELVAHAIHQQSLRADAVCESGCGRPDRFSF